MNARRATICGTRSRPVCAPCEPARSPRDVTGIPVEDAAMAEGALPVT
ncbi:hypothetical protein WMF18_04060 [Sorangium sp. So ce315]